MKITSVEPQKRNTRRFNIFLDGKFAFGADEDLVVDRRLVVGKEILPEDLEKILFETEVGKLMERMYGLFNIRQRSEKEIRDYFRNLSFKRKIKDQDGISDLAIDSVIEILKRKRLLDDLEFAKSWVDARRKSKKKGINALKQELFQKGINKEIAEEVLSIENQLVSEEELAEQAMERKMRIWKNLEPPVFKKKAYDFLMRRGFEYDVVRLVVEKFLKLK